MQFVILVPLAWLPLLIIGMVVWEVVGDYLVTMLGWFVLALVADVILFVLLMPVSQANAASFAICLLLIPVLAPFVGCYVRSEREQRQEQRLEDLKRAARKRQDDLSYQKPLPWWRSPGRVFAVLIGTAWLWLLLFAVLRARASP
jgi:hypothetical protein